MTFLQWRSLVSLALVGASFAPLGAAAPVAPDWLSVVGLYPQPGTVTAQSELAIMLWLQGSRTDQDVARARSEATPSFGCFASAIHPGGNALAAPGPIEIGNFPRTAALLDQARADVTPLLESLGNTFLRPLPYQSFPALTPVLAEPAPFSYPSVHATLGVLFARILDQFDPDDQVAIGATGHLLGTDRVLGGVHYPSDVEAGQRLGNAFATWWIDQPEHLQLFQAACGEWHRQEPIRDVSPSLPPAKSPDTL
jgi:membrane-associated phospholipid phosphatase